MTKKRNAPSQSEDREVFLSTARGDARTQIENRILKAQALLEMGNSIRDEAMLSTARAAYYSWDEFNTELLARLFTGDKYKTEYVDSFFFGGRDNFSDRVKELNRDIEKKVRRLKSIAERLELIPETPTPQTKEIARGLRGVVANNSKIFVVHGQKQSTKQEVARFLEKGGLNAVILHEQASHGSSPIIEKFERHSEAV